MTELNIKFEDETECARCGLDLLAGDKAILSLGEIYCSENCAKLAMDEAAREAEIVHPRNSHRTVVLNKSTLDVVDWSIAPGNYPEE
jgi:hypothetical protein